MLEGVKNMNKTKKETNGTKVMYRRETDWEKDEENGESKTVTHNANG